MEPLEQAVDAYVAAWNERDPQLRNQLLDRAITDDCEFHGPTGTFRGRQAIEGLIVALQGRMGDAVVERTGPIHGDDRRFLWAVRVNEDVVFSGVDTVDTSPDGRLVRVEAETLGSSG